LHSHTTTQPEEESGAPADGKKKSDSHLWEKNGAVDGLNLESAGPDLDGVNLNQRSEMHISGPLTTDKSLPTGKGTVKDFSGVKLRKNRAGLAPNSMCGDVSKASEETGMVAVEEADFAGMGISPELLGSLENVRKDSKVAGKAHGRKREGSQKRRRGGGDLEEALQGAALYRHI
jgi:hypothetical protein